MGAVMEQVIIKGNLQSLSEADRVMYYNAVCNSVGLNPLTQPLEYIVLNGKLTLYWRKAATDQIRALRHITITSLTPSREGELLLVVATGRDATGREDSAIGAVSIKGLAGEALANAVMKAETKAKRRLTLPLAGLGFTTEDDLEGIVTDPVPPEPPQSLAERVQARKATIAPPAEPEPAVEPLGDFCGDEDASPMALGVCDQPAKHAGVHKSGLGSWPR
jgi:hypothetical protein